MRLIAFVVERAVILGILDHRGEPSGPPRAAFIAGFAAFRTGVARIEPVNLAAAQGLWNSYPLAIAQ